MMLSEKEFIAKYLTQDPQLGFAVGDRVTFKNDYGVKFKGCAVIGFADGRVHTSGDAFWAGKKPESLKKEGAGLPQPQGITAIYDNGGKTYDRFTFVLSEKEGNSLWSCLATCATGRGFSQFSTCAKGSHLGKKLTWSKVPAELQRHIVTRMGGL